MEKQYKYKTLGEFAKAYPSEYSHLHNKNLLDKLCEDMGWKRGAIPNFWTYEKCKLESSKYSRIQDWRENSSPSYNKSKREGWLDELTLNMVKSFIPMDSWVKESCIENARKYNKKTDWRRENNSAYKASIKNGWYDECIAHMVSFFSPTGYWTKERCHIEALKFDMKEKWKKGHNVSYSNATRKGWVKECSGHMVEGCKKRNYWTKERCHSEALRFDIKEKWKKGHPQSYQASRRNGWVPELTTHMMERCKPNGYWQNKERCIAEAKKYTTQKEWNSNSTTSVQVAVKNGWIDECTAHMIKTQKPNGYWQNKERCIAEAKKYDNIGKWCSKSSASYNQTRKNGWLDECTAHMVNLRKPLNIWTLETCLVEALKFNTRNEWQKANSACYRASKLFGWFEECTKHMVILKRPKISWTLEACVDKAKNYISKPEWKKGSYQSYKTAYDNNWFEECTKHMPIIIKKTRKIWTKELCLVEALKFKTRLDWKNGHSFSYNASVRYGWNIECTAHMVKKITPRGFWDKEKCLAEASKYFRKIDWIKNSSASYQTAYAKGWFEECTAHMNTRKLTKELCLAEASKYSTRKEWKKNHSPTLNSAKRNGWYDECTAHMTRLLKPRGYWEIKENCLAEALNFKSKQEWQLKSNGSKKSAKQHGWYDECTKHMKNNKID